MAKISNFDLSAKQLVDFALEKFRKGDIFGSARYVRNALLINKRLSSAYGVLGCLFSDINEFDIANKVLFKGLHESRDYSGVVLRRQLALNFLKMNQPEVAMFYADDDNSEVADMLDDIFADMESDPVPELFRSYPPTEEYCAYLLAKAYELANDGDMESAMKVVDNIPEQFDDMVVKSKLVMLTMNNDIDSVIEFSERMINEGRDNVPVRCALASAYLLKNRDKEAREVAEPLFEQVGRDVEKMFMVLPVAVSLEMHSEIIKIINAVYDRPNIKTSRRLLLWYSQALYNIGEHESAKAVMSDLNALYGEEAPAFYYLDLYAKSPEKAEYSLVLPKDGRDKNLSTVCGILMMSDEELEKFDKTHTAVGDNLDYYIHWALSNCNMQDVLIPFILRCRRASEIMQNSLISGELQYATMSAIIDAFVMLNDGIHPVTFDIVSQDRFKHIEFMRPRATHRLPSTLRNAVLLSIADIIFTDEDPNFYLGRFTKLINGMVDLGEGGKLVYSGRPREKLSSLRSADTLVGVFLSKVYEEDETRESVIERYKLNEKLYDKYYNIIFGENDD